MSVPYDTFTEAFLSKTTEYEFVTLPEKNRQTTVDGYMKRAITHFKKVCRYDLSKKDDETREYDVEILDEDIDEIIEIISEGMVVQWLKPYVNHQELLQNVLNTRDFTQYSPAELLMRVGNAYKEAQKNFTQMIREYSYDHGELTELYI